VSIASSPPPTGRDALTLRDDGLTTNPQTTDWDEWVSAGKTRNWCNDDPLLDWLARYGRAKGFVPDDELKGFEPRTDFLRFVFAHGKLFEQKILELLGTRADVHRVGDGRLDAQDLAKAEATFDAMCGGVEIISQGVVRNPQNRTYGCVDLLMRSDIVNTLVPHTLSPAQATANAPALGREPWHYVVADIKFSTLHLLKNGHAASGHLPFMAQLWTYNEALGRTQGFTSRASYLLGRCWQSSSERGTGCFERLATVEHTHVVPRTGARLGDLVAEAVAWIIRMRQQGASWDVLPVPSVPELYPHARHAQDQPWHRVKSFIASELAELTLLPAVNPERRRCAHAQGLLRWDDPQVTAQRLGITSQSSAAKCDAVLAANRRSNEVPVLPTRISRIGDTWRTPAPLELYVDFETVSNLADDFRALPDIGGQPLIFQIGCGRYEGNHWEFWQRTTQRLDEPSEAQVIDAWVAHIDELLATKGLDMVQLRVIHWSHAESSSLDTAYNAARKRHHDHAWPDIPWFDALTRVVRAEPVTVRGAFGFGLKAVAKAMHEAGLIPTSWEDGPTDGLGAMVGAWWCDSEAARAGCSLEALPLMRDIGRYNEVDCRAMAEALAWLRTNR